MASSTDRKVRFQLAWSLCCLLIGLLFLAPTGFTRAASADAPVIRVGLLIHDSVPVRLRQLEVFRGHLELKIGRAVEIIPHTNWASLLRGIEGKRVDYAMLSAGSFAVGDLTCECLEAIAVPSAEDGGSALYGALFVGKDSSITDLLQMQDKAIAVLGENAMASHLVPFADISAGGVTPSRFFSDILFVDDPEAALDLLESGDVAGVLSWTRTDRSAGTAFQDKPGGLVRYRMSYDKRLEKLNVVWRSNPIMFGPHTVRRDLDNSIKQRLQDALLTLHQNSPTAHEIISRHGYLGPLQPVDNADYNPIKRGIQRNWLGDQTSNQ